MRCNEPIKVTFSIPVPIDEPDDNGVSFTKEAIINAVKNFKKDVPLVVGYNKNDKLIGVIKSISYLEETNNMLADGIIFFGGTNEKAERNEEGLVKDMEILLFGIDAEGVKDNNAK